jgi:putative PEP-CTERM system histidine kinase
MYLDFILPAAACFLCLCLGLIALLGTRSFVYRIFALGMLILAVEQFFSILAIRSDFLSAFLQWDFFKMLAGAFIPCVWLAFSICYAREDCRKNLLRSRWVLLAAAIFPAAVICFFRASLFTRASFSHEWIVRFGWPAYLYNLSILSIAILILVKLEKTLRSSSGAIRWRIKFMALGIGSLFAVRIYSTAERLLFVGDHSLLFTIDSGTLIFADLLVVISLLRTRLQNINVYVSQDFLYNSIIISVVGVYLLTLGVVAQVARYFGASEVLLHNAFVIFIAVVGVAVLFLSSGIKFAIRKFISRHFKRPVHDYRKIWGSFTERTASLVDLYDQCNAMVRTVSEEFGVSSVSIWLNDELRNAPVLCGSTHLSLTSELNPDFESEIRFLALSSRDRKAPVRLDSAGQAAGDEGPSSDSGGNICCCVPLLAGGEFLGIITLGRKLTKEEFTVEDFDLLRTIADQAAGLILNHKLFERLGHAREMQAFQAVSAFFAHDLKNVASTLSLTLTNMPVHYENPEFRADALKMISKSVEKIQNMCGRLSALNQQFELHRCECDLNELVANTLSSLKLNCALVTDLGPVPRVSLDPEQIQKVILNLVLNAGESAAEGTEIRIATSRNGDHLLLSVTDQGCGMSREFINESLFHPFKTTKKRGLGIGLYQCKMIVEAHRGRIEVESREGHGSTFRVILPVAA